MELAATSCSSLLVLIVILERIGSPTLRSTGWVLLDGIGILKNFTISWLAIYLILHVLV